MKNNSVCNGCKYYSVCGDDSRAVACDGFEKAVAMKTVEQIDRTIKKNRETIETTEKEIANLSMSEARAAAFHDHNKERLHELHAVAATNAEKIAALCEKVYLLKVENMILYDNRKARIFADVMPIIETACKPFIGKSYGDKTRHKIADAVRAAGYSFFFGGYHYDTLEFCKLNPRGGACGSDYIKAYADSWEYRFIDSDNKLAFDPSRVRVPVKYIENPKAHAKKVVKAYEEYKKALEKAEKAQEAMNEIKPTCIDHFNKVSNVYRSLV